MITCRLFSPELPVCDSTEFVCTLGSDNLSWAWASPDTFTTIELTIQVVSAAAAEREEMWKSEAFLFN